MACTEGIAKAILSDCSTSRVGGLEVEAYIFNRGEVTVTYDATNPSLITNLVNIATKKAYKITGIKKLLNAGSDIVVADDRANKYAHYFNFQQFECAAADLENVTNMDDVFVVVEYKQKQSTNGTYIAYGAKNGLYKSTDTHRANDLDGARNIEMTSMSGSEEIYDRYPVYLTSYVLTKALLEGCLTVPV